MRGRSTRGLGAALPGRQPVGDLLEPAERARRLGELGLAAHHLGLGREVRSRQLAQDAAHFVESWLCSGRSSRARTILYSPDHDQSPTTTNAPSAAGPSSFDEWLQAFKEQASFFTGLKLDVGVPRWQLADVLPVLPFIGAGVGLAAGLVFAVVRGLAGPGWLAGRAGGRRCGADHARPA